MLNSNRFFITLLLLLTTCQSQGYLTFYAQAEAENKTPILLLGDCHMPGEVSDNHKQIVQEFIEAASLSNTTTTWCLEGIPTGGYKPHLGTLHGLCNFVQKTGKKIGAVDAVLADARSVVSMLISHFLYNYFVLQGICKIGETCNSLEELAATLNKKKSWDTQLQLLKKELKKSGRLAEITFDEIVKSIENVLSHLESAITSNNHKSEQLDAMYREATNNLKILKRVARDYHKPFVDILWELASKKGSFKPIVEFAELFRSLNLLCADLGFGIELLKVENESDRVLIFFTGQAHSERLIELLKDRQYQITTMYNAKDTGDMHAPLPASELEELLDSYYQKYYENIPSNEREFIQVVEPSFFTRVFDEVSCWWQRFLSWFK